MASVLRQKVVKSGDKYAERSRTSNQASRVENVQTRVRTLISQIDAQPNAAFGILHLTLLCHNSFINMMMLRWLSIRW